MLDDIRAQLRRIAATEFRVALDNQFEPHVGALLKVERDASYWHMLPEHFLELLKELPDGAGDQQVHLAIETKAVSVWHGPAPQNARDTAL